MFFFPMGVISAATRRVGGDTGARLWLLCSRAFALLQSRAAAEQAIGARTCVHLYEVGTASCCALISCLRPNTAVCNQSLRQKKRHTGAPAQAYKLVSYRH